MTTFAQSPSVLDETRCFGPATVVETRDAAGNLRVILTDRPEDGQKPAQIAIHTPDPLRVGDRVLVAGGDADGLYVIGVLENRRPETSRRGDNTFNSDADGRLDVGGAYAVANDTARVPTLRVFSPEGDLVFEYDPDSGKARVHIQNGDLELVAPQGDMAVRCGGTLRFDAGQIEMTARHRVVVRVADAIGKLRSVLSLGHQGTELTSPDFTCTAGRGSFQFGETQIASGKVVANLGEAKCYSRRFETVTKTLIEKAKNVYRSAEGLTQLRSRRVRTLVDETYHLQSKTAMLKSEDDFKINGERIHLG